ncbi:helix-turn-helix domain-containing protein [Pseudonocardia sp. C8]|uniref:IclR family transcriptional regulator n=1 Tax=Pseudonocardia sp. C8 TaxID=2762759 RepID=UPI001642AC4A|nr:IclR family transcriptional regulator C-terminal domain-containing protein [Pseudonocardia sp. C8]MBC3191941.1 helix-turn-helix domain-containing protein [Pseudonocardia sp. C8]
MKNKPAYGIDSVDHALHLATILLQEGSLRITDAAERLGVSRSTAHRLLAMLVYRDFAEQDDRRRYVAGPLLRRPTVPEPVADLRRIAVPHLHGLTATTGETANLVVVLGDQARFVATVECDQVLRVGDREGRTLPAHLVSAGRAVLATRTEAAVRELYAGSAVTDPDVLLRDLRRVRRRGFAVNDQRTETGLIAVGAAVPGTVSAGPGPAGVSLAMPTVRYRRDRLPEWGRAVVATAERVGRDLDWAASMPGGAR